MPVSLYNISTAALKKMREVSPYDTGNLRDNGIWLVRTGKNEYTVSIGAPTAPYAVYTNEVWVSPRWNGKPNPNEHWIDTGVQMVVREIMSTYGGKLVMTKGDLEAEADRWMNKSYWESEEGQKKLKEYKIDDYKSVVSRTPPKKA